MYDLYSYYIVGVLFVFPVISIIIEYRTKKDKLQSRNLPKLIFKWFIFWFGIRSFTAGLSQFLNPAFTASILHSGETSFVVIKELGFANMAMGLAGIISLFAVTWRRPAAFSIGVFILGATIIHVLRLPQGINMKEMTALLNDIYKVIVISAYFIYSYKDKNKNIVDKSIS